MFHRGPCFPYYLPPIGQDLHLTIVSTDDADPANPNDGDAGRHDANQAAGGVDASQNVGQDGGQTDKDSAAAADDHKLNTISAMYAALRACWVPPPRDEARHGMEYTVRFAFKRDGEMIAPPRTTYSSHDAPPEVRDVYRDAVNAALARCTPLPFTDGMGGAVAGRPIAIRFVDDRTIDSAKDSQH